MSRVKSKVKPHVFAIVPDLSDPRMDVYVCRCGLPQDHPSHTMPDAIPDAQTAAAGEKGDA